MVELFPIVVGASAVALVMFLIGGLVATICDRVLEESE